jgi:hypothetical protein
LTLSFDAKAKSGVGQQASRGYRFKKAKSTKRILLGTDNPTTFLMP